MSFKIALVFLIVAANLQYCAVSGNRCTAVLSRNEIHEKVKQTPCIQKYTARCGWLSLNYCTFYHNTLCDKKVNDTVKIYFIKTGCCEGYFQATNGSCIKKVPGVNYDNLLPTSTSTTEDPNYVRPVDKTKKVDSVEQKISGGVYAGIICGMVLLVSIIVFIVIAIRKKKKKEKSAVPKSIAYHVPQSNTPIVRQNVSPSRSLNFQRENTPSTSQRVTPPASPVKTVLEDSEYGTADIPMDSQTTPLKTEATPSEEVTAATPLVYDVENLKDENLPESDI